MIVADIGIPAGYLQSDLGVWAGDLALFQPRRRMRIRRRPRAGSGGGGRPAQRPDRVSGLRMGAGLVTKTRVRILRSSLRVMTQPLDTISLDRITVLAVGPLGLNRELVEKIAEC